MKTLFIIILNLFPMLIIQAQQLEVVSSGGGYLETNEGSISFCIGEVVTESLFNGQCCLTQGFCQSNITVTAVEEIPGINFELLVYPNPTKNYVILKIAKASLKGLKYLLFDMNGRMIDHKPIVSAETNIPFYSFIPSTYFLKVYENNQEIKVFKIIKSR